MDKDAKEKLKRGRPKKPPAEAGSGGARVGAAVDIPSRAYAILESKLGMKETGNNTGEIVSWAVAPWSTTAPDETGWAKWCAGSVCTAYLEAGSAFVKTIGTLSVRKLLDRLQARQLAYAVPESTTHIKRGDLVFFQNNGQINHVGMVSHFDPATGKLWSLEGNHNNQVEMVERSSWYCFSKMT